MSAFAVAAMCALLAWPPAAFGLALLIGRVVEQRDRQVPVPAREDVAS